MRRARPKRVRPQQKLDLYASHRREYAASREPAFVTVQRARYLAITGQGRPGASAFQESIGALYTVAYTVKMARKFSGRDFVVAKLEGQYWWDDLSGDMPMEQCRWQLLVRVPTFITDREVKGATARLLEQGKPARVSDVALIALEEGRCVQMLHVGPYDAEPVTIAEMTRFAESAGLHFVGKHHEIYLSDPRRVAPERIRTILRQPVA